MTNKQALRDALLATLEAELAVAEAAQRATQGGATHEEARPENDKDTRALELSYLARGQARRVDELRTAVAETRAMPVRDFDEGAPVAVSALVTVEDDKGERTLFLALHGGGTKLADGVTVVTTRSPLGRALLGKRAGDDCEFRDLTVVDVR